MSQPVHLCFRAEQCRRGPQHHLGASAPYLGNLNLEAGPASPGSQTPGHPERRDPSALSHSIHLQPEGVGRVCLSQAGRQVRRGGLGLEHRRGRSGAQVGCRRAGAEEQWRQKGDGPPWGWTARQWTCGRSACVCSWPDAAAADAGVAEVASGVLTSPCPVAWAGTVARCMPPVGPAQAASTPALAARRSAVRVRMCPLRWVASRRVEGVTAWFRRKGGCPPLRSTARASRRGGGSDRSRRR